MIKQSRSTYLTVSALALAIMAAAGSASAAIATATSTSTVVTPITITKNADLSFGSFAPGATPGTVIVSPNNTRAVTGGVVAMGGTATAAQFAVSGQDGSTYAITLGGSASLTSGANSMTFTSISALTASAATSGNVSSGTLTGGSETIYVGGVLDVAANQAAGTYTGTVSATVEYN